MRIFASMLAASLLLPAAVMAQDMNVGPTAGDWEATLSGNGTSNNDFDDHNLGVSGSVGKYLTDSWLVGARQSINLADLPGSNDQVNGATRGFADYVFNLGKFRPYVGVSVGGIYGEGVADTFAAGPQAGLKYYADKRTFLFAQTEYQFTFRDVEDADNQADDGQFFHTIGIGFNF